MRQRGHQVAYTLQGFGWVMQANGLGKIPIFKETRPN